MATTNNSSEAPLTLKEHLALLGIDANHLACLCGFPVAIVQRVLAGHEIVLPHAERICYELSTQHGLKHAVGFVPADIKGLKIHRPPAHVAKEKVSLLAGQINEAR